jgi:hypothetical protein
MAVVTELITKFGFEGSLDPLNNYNGSLGQGIKLLAGLGAALGGVLVGINTFAAGTSRALQPLIDLNSQTDVSVEKLQELSFIALQSSSTTEALFSSIAGLSTKIGEAAQKGSDDFSRLGISVRTASGRVKSADTVLAEVSDRFRQLGLSMSEQKSFAEALGIDATLLSMLNRTRSEMAGLSAEAQRLGILTTEQVKSAENFNDALGALGFGMDAVKRLISVGLAPELTAMTKDFMDLLAANKDFIVDGIKATVGVLNGLVDALVRVAPFIAAAGAAFLLAKVHALGFAGALALVFSPAIIAALAISGVVLLIDDLVVAFQGGQSVIRDFFREAMGFDIQPALVAMVDGFEQAFVTVKDLVLESFDGIVTIFAGIGGILSGNFESGFADIGKGLTQITDSFAKGFRRVFGDVFDFLEQKILGILPDWAVNFIQNDSDAAAGMGASQALQPGGRSGVMDQYSLVDQTVNMTINTADPERAGRAAADGVQRELNNARNQLINRQSR